MCNPQGGHACVTTFILCACARSLFQRTEKRLTLMPLFVWRSWASTLVHPTCMLRACHPLNCSLGTGGHTCTWHPSASGSFGCGHTCTWHPSVSGRWGCGHACTWHPSVLGRCGCGHELHPLECPLQASAERPVLCTRIKPFVQLFKVGSINK